MQNIQDLQDRIFSDCRNMITKLSETAHAEDLLAQQNLVSELSKKMEFLNLLKLHTEENIFSEHPITTENISSRDDEAVFDSQIHDIVENEFHEALINSAQEESIVEILAENEDVNTFVNQEFNDQNNEISDEEQEQLLADQELINDQLNEIDEFENEISDDDGSANSFEEEEAILTSHENSISEKETDLESDKNSEEMTENLSRHDDEMITENSNVETLVSDLKESNHVPEENQEERGKIQDLEREISDEIKEKPASDESFENLDAYQQERKIRLANIKGLKSIQSLFDDDHLEAEIPAKESSVEKDSGSLLKTNIPTNFMEAEKPKPEFRLDLNDRMAFTKMLFNGSQADLNEAVTNLNRCRNLEEAKVYLSDLYYDKKWDKVDDYAQRLWILVENKFL